MVLVVSLLLPRPSSLPPPAAAEVQPLVLWESRYPDSQRIRLPGPPRRFPGVSCCLEAAIGGSQVFRRLATASHS
ncbi:hypothetical protein NDU88_003442 [Pleurodeles waltl]|uniref:Secreted protein n=1 Tax=Pleurodeles waltl TaxID=8319 RepID=A0AAV7T654_PLEWA|nr:hypothetical protein NDU88_003442 [Pleurodeles waltl]